MTWRLDAANAALYSRANPRRVAPGCEHFQGRCACDPPDYHRCEYVDENGTRCAGAPNHLGDHRLPRPTPRTVAA